MAWQSEQYPKKSYWDEYMPHYYGRYKWYHQEKRAWEYSIEQGVTPRRRRSPRMLEAATFENDNRRPLKSWKYTRRTQYYDGPRALCALIAGIEHAASFITQFHGATERVIPIPRIELEDSPLVLERVRSHAHWSDIAWPWFSYFQRDVVPLPHLPEERVLERGTIFDLFRRAQVKWHITDLEESDLVQLWYHLRNMARELKKEYNKKARECIILLQE